jgi:magnesium transporter
MEPCIGPPALSLSKGATIHDVARSNWYERWYFTTNIFNVVRRRIVWLFLLILVNTVTGSVIAGQSELLEEVVILAAFMPLLIGTGGNVGAPSSTVIIRGLATGEISSGRTVLIVLREIGVGFLLVFPWG